MLTLYRASAGAGKTHTLTGEYLKMLFGSGNEQETEAEYRHILAVTFTNKATAEMKDRIIRELYDLASGRPSGHLNTLLAHGGRATTEARVRSRARTLLVRMLHDYAAFNVSTIDHFFQQTLRAFVREIGLQGNYRVELDSNTVITEAVDNLLASLDSTTERTDLFRWLLQFSENKVEQGKTWNLRQEICNLGKELFKEHYKSLREEAGSDVTDRKTSAEYSRMLYAIINKVKSESRQLGIRGLELMKKHGLQPEEFKYKGASGFMFFKKLANGNMEEGPTARFLSLPDNIEMWGDDLRISQVYADGLNACVKDVIHFYETRMTDFRTARAIADNFYTRAILSDIEQEIRRLNNEKNSLLLADTAELLTHIIGDSDVPFIYEKTGTRIRHYLIDEFQDTSAMQWRNFRPLVADSLAAGHADLIVGDVKQSIYRFRNSDWTLLDSRIGSDFPSDIQPRTLDENWRSRPEIVHFNNALFSVLPQRLQAEYDRSLERSTLTQQQRDPYAGRIQAVYAGNLQSVAPPLEGKPGHVRVELIDKQKVSPDEEENEKAQWMQRAIERMLLSIGELRRHGRSWGQIAILTRKRDEAALVTDALLRYGRQHPEEKLQIITDEGLTIQGSSAVRFIAGMLRYLNRPDDKTAADTAALLFHAMRIRSEGKPTDATLPNEPLPADASEEWLRPGHRSLYEAVEALCRIFGSDFPADELIFVQAFLDLAADYSEREGADIDRFLTWWKEAGSQTKIATPEAQDALRIMTLHKAKGLGFDVVILPFAEWEIDSDHRTVLWCRPRVAPFDSLSFVPVNYKKTLPQTIFAREYFDEKLHAYIDGLNMLYVSLTRAKQELIVFVPFQESGKDSKSKSNEEKAPKLCQLLGESLRSAEVQTAGAGCQISDEGRCFEWGTWVDCAPPAATTDAFPLDDSPVMHHLPSVRPDERMYLRLFGRSFDDAQRDYGVLMHDLLSHIRTTNDLSAAISAKVSAGQIDRRSATILEERMRTLLATPSVRSWFDGSMNVLTEAEILFGDGRSRRPDRVMLSPDGRRALIVDYKFGLRKSPRYVRQIRDYMTLMHTMGYPDVRGNLWYVELGEIQEINET